jgi:hypothetical protein
LSKFQKAPKSSKKFPPRFQKVPKTCNFLQKIASIKLDSSKDYDRVRGKNLENFFVTPFGAVPAPITNISTSAIAGQGLGGFERSGQRRSPLQELHKS